MSLWLHQALEDQGLNSLGIGKKKSNNEDCSRRRQKWRRNKQWQAGQELLSNTDHFQRSCVLRVLEPFNMSELIRFPPKMLPSGTSISYQAHAFPFGLYCNENTYFSSCFQKSSGESSPEQDNQTGIRTTEFIVIKSSAPGSPVLFCSIEESAL